MFRTFAPRVTAQRRDSLLAKVAFEAVWERDIESRTLVWDGNVESIFGYRLDEVGGDVDWWLERVHRDDAERVLRVADEAIRDGGAGWSNEYRFRRKDGSWAWVSSRCAIERDDLGQARHAIGAMIDVNRFITDRLRSEQRMREGERLLRQVIDTLPVGVVVLDQAGDITLDNPAMREIWGGAVVRGHDRWAASKGKWHDSGRQIAAGEWASCRALHGGQASRDELIDIETYVGDQKTIESYAAPIRDADGVITGAVAVHGDVTQRVRAEQELARRAAQLETMSRKLIEAQETERRAIARELHDDFGQVLTALRLNLLRGDGNDPETIALVDGATARMRDLAQWLRPPLLDERGLEASLSWYAEREAKRAGLQLRLAVVPFHKRPPVTLEAAAFRIAQEALTNVVRHAAASMVEIELAQVDRALRLVVRDDGRGFDVAAARTRALDGQSQGLINMQERATLAGGDLDIASSPGGGTSIRVRLPLSRR
jgi:PAS domain S-box-containing protein